MNVPRCQSVNYQDKFNEVYTLRNDDYLTQGIFMSQYHQTTGCTSCTNNSDVLVYMDGNDANLDNRVCSQMEDHSVANSFQKSQTIIIGCITHGILNNKLVCYKCDAANNYFKTQDGQCFLDDTNNVNLKNCELGDSKTGNICIKCKTNYINIGGLCRQQTTNDDNAKYLDAKCTTYSEKSKKTHKSVCETCNSNYYAQKLDQTFNKCESIPSSQTNCVNYSKDQGCTQCQNGYGLVEVIKNRNINNKFKTHCMKMDNVTVGSFDHDPNCMKMVSSSDTFNLGKQKLKCLECKSNSSTPQVLINQASTLKYDQKCYRVKPAVTNCSTYEFNTAVTEKIKNSHFNCTQCENNTFWLDQVTNECKARNNKQNCKVYEVFKDVCKTCNDGYYLSETTQQCTTFETNELEGYINSCIKMSTCNNEVMYKGLNAGLHSLFSCHQCQDPNMIPFSSAYIVRNDDFSGLNLIHSLKKHTKQFIPFRLNDTNMVYDSESVTCMKATKENFGITNATNFVFPTNCGLGLVNLQPTSAPSQTNNAQNSSDVANFTEQTGNVRCAACKPGFKATTKSENNSSNTNTQKLNYFVSSCDVITNCEQKSTWFNACSQCQPDYAYGYDPSKGILFDKCVQVQNNENCYAFDDRTDVQKCKYCRKGTYLNLDGYCEIIHATKCEFRQFRFNDYYQNVDLTYGLSFSPHINGCNKCQEGYVGIYEDKDFRSCTHSLYHAKDKVSTSNQTFYIKGCLNYHYNDQNNYICKKCKDQFIMSSDGKCYSNTTLTTNCVLASSVSLCDKCKDGFVLVNRRCVASVIENCIEYLNNQEIKKTEFQMNGYSKQLCTQCKSSYYLAKNQCHKGSVQNCKELETSSICNVCEDGYTLVQKKNSESYCYKIDPRFNCSEYDSDKLQSSILQCNKCKDKKHILSVSESDRSVQVCAQFNFIENCDQYNNNPIAIADSGFKCLKCEQHTYLSNGTCLLRTNYFEECLVYSQNADRCEKCNNGYFITDDGKSCSVYPSGIYGCLEFYNSYTCLKCNINLYLKDNKCLPIQNLITNCKFYDDANVCNECNTGFVLQNNSCISPVAQGCRTYENKNACKDCNIGFSLAMDKGIISCVSITIQNCSETSLVSPYNCTKCNLNHVLNGEVCEAVTTQITDCIEYVNQTTCAKCNKLTALSSDQNSCLKTPDVIKYIDLQCDDNVITSNLICNSCKPGYLFSYGKCISCSKQQLSSGCINCDPNDQNKCLMCASGYTQLPEGFCVKSVLEIPEDVTSKQ